MSDWWNMRAVAFWSDGSGGVRGMNRYGGRFGGDEARWDGMSSFGWAFCDVDGEIGLACCGGDRRRED
jgi:hypothetical protein